MRNLEGLMVETGRVIHRRYLLQRLLKQGQTCAVYQGFDQVLQRAVAVKIAPAEHIATYRAAIRATSQFAHPNIIGIYDLIVEPEILYIVQEYVDGDDFAALLQTQLSPHQVVDLGIQICQALIYAGSSTRKVCHGDLTPSAVLRDRRGLVRVNNFALPSDTQYFASWSAVGGDGLAVSDRGLPWGQQSEARRADDTRAVGLLLYQLLAGRPPGATSVEPPPDGRLRFLRSVPPELCDIVARAIVRQHPQHITTAETLHAELKVLAEALEPPIVAPVASAYQTEEAAMPRQFGAPKSGILAPPLAPRETDQVSPAGAGAIFPSNTSSLAAAPSDPTVADLSVNLPLGHPPFYSQMSAQQAQTSRVSLPLLFLLALLLFGIFFGAGYLIAHALFVH
jgi:serine/threonine protein kinase